MGEKGKGVKGKNFELPEIPGGRKVGKQDPRGYERMMDEHA